jgi:hypothetical protein
MLLFSRVSGDIMNNRRIVLLSGRTAVRPDTTVNKIFLIYQEYSFYRNLFLEFLI